MVSAPPTVLPAGAARHSALTSTLANSSDMRCGELAATNKKLEFDLLTQKEDQVKTNPSNATRH